MIGCLLVPAACAPGNGGESASTEPAPGVVDVTARGLTSPDATRSWRRFPAPVRRACCARSPWS